jgi:hypothetical protein
MCAALQLPYNNCNASQIHGFGKLSPLEQKLLDENVPTLQSQAQKGVDFVNKA